MHESLYDMAYYNLHSLNDTILICDMDSMDQAIYLPTVRNNKTGIPLVTSLTNMHGSMYENRSLRGFEM